MGLKMGLNKMEQKKVPGWLADKIPVEDIAKRLKTTPEIVLRFTAEKQEAVKKDQVVREKKQLREKEALVEKGKIVANALNETTNSD